MTNLLTKIEQDYGLLVAISFAKQAIEEDRNFIRILKTHKNNRTTGTHIVSKLLTWSLTKEGHKYWSNISTALNEEEYSISYNDLEEYAAKDLDNNNLTLLEAMEKAEGKIVEFKHPQVGYKDWEIVTQEHIFQSVVLGREYRIKPEEPKFKVGDWVRDGKNIYQFIEPSSTYSYEASLNRCELWRPKLGEWCWVGYKLMKFNKLIKEDYSTTFEFIFPDRDADGYRIKEHILERHLQVVEPFIGQLPSYLKE